ncbi:MAG: hypothetical protein QM831_42445 [Kofleriaceae bacterium]
MKNAVAIAGTLLSLTAYAAADDDVAPAATGTRTTTADTLVVVTPNAPVVVTNGQAQASQAPGAQENPPAPAPAAGQAAPMTNNWNDVSHINGTVVPYGEHNTYLNTYKKVNISADPIAMMFGYYQFAGSYAVSQNVALSVQFSAWSRDNGSSSGTEFAVSAPIYLKRAYSGPFVEPGLIIHTDSSSNDCYDCYADTSTMGTSYVGPEMLVGWSWLFDSGLNMSFAIGASKRIDSNNSDPDPAGYFRVGYAF